jgi:hypothetical protein
VVLEDGRRWQNDFVRACHRLRHSIFIGSSEGFSLFGFLLKGFNFSFVHGLMIRGKSIYYWRENASPIAQLSSGDDEDHQSPFFLTFLLICGLWLKREDVRVDMTR